MATTKSEDKVTKSKAPPASAGAKKPVPEGTPSDQPPVPKAPAETLDLLEPKKKVKRRDVEGGAPKPVLPPIQKIHARPPVKSEAVVEQPPPAPEPVQPVEVSACRGGSRGA